jgi:hypothetical protein
MSIEMKMVLVGVAVWLARGCLSAYRQRAELKTTKDTIAVILGGGGPRPK